MVPELARRRSEWLDIFLPQYEGGSKLKLEVPMHLRSARIQHPFSSRSMSRCKDGRTRNVIQLYVPLKARAQGEAALISLSHMKL